MTEILLTIILLALIGYLFWYTHQNNLREAKYIKALLAKNLPELDQSIASEGFEDKEEKPPEFVPVEDADQATFDKMIKENQ